MELYGARMSVLLPSGCGIGRDENSRRKHPDVRKLKSGACFVRHCLQGAHSEAPQETPTVIGFSGPNHTVPVVGETAAARANHQVTHVVRAPHLWLRQRAKSAQVGLRDGAPRGPSPSRRRSPPLPTRAVPRIFEGHVINVWQAILNVKYANYVDLRYTAVVRRRKDRRDDPLELCSWGPFCGDRGCYLYRSAGTPRR